jgi:chromosome partitioning protein
VIELWRYMADRLEKNFRRTVFSAPGAQPMALPQRTPGVGFGRRGVGQ